MYEISKTDYHAKLLGAAVGGYWLGCFTVLVIMPLLQRLF